MTYRSVDGCSILADGCKLHVVFSRLRVDYWRTAQLYGHYSNYGNCSNYSPYSPYGHYSHYATTGSVQAAALLWILSFADVGIYIVSKALVTIPI